MTVEELDGILAQHSKWLENTNTGSHADLRGANLYGANLRGADLRGANLYGANLRGADLRGADLSHADLSHADLSHADLRGADLRHADLRHADLRGANLSHANLSNANLSNANLCDANLRGANLSHADLCDASLYGANLRGAKNISTIVAACTSIVAGGTITGWKKCRHGVIVRLTIPADAKRSNATGRKCRAERAIVEEVFGASVGVSLHDDRVKYTVGKIMIPNTWCDDRWQECAGGIHFFITREEAEAYAPT